MKTIVATGHNSGQDGSLVEGTWKFQAADGRKDKTNDFPFQVTEDELVESVIDLINQNPGGGEFLTASVPGTADDEIGVHFLYRLSEKEVGDKYALTKYVDFWQRRHGAVYKGYSIGRNPIQIVLEEQDAAA